MQLFGKDLSTDTVVIAEVGVNHEGSLEKAIELVGMAADAGADAVKFQAYDPIRYASTSDMERFERVGRFGLAAEEFAMVAKEAESRGIVFFASALDESSVALVDSLSPVLKIASPDLTFEPTVRAAAATGKPLVISTGLGLPEEIDRTLRWVQEEIGSVPLQDRVVLLHCITSYPTPLEQANLNSIPYLRDRYGVHVGYSDHTLGLTACRAAVALGATVIEKHFTDQNEGRAFRDHELSADPEDLKLLVEEVKAIRGALGTWGKHRAECELPNLNAVRKGVVAARDLGVGIVLSRQDLMYARPATAYSADQIDDLVGCRLTQPLAKGNLILVEALEEPPPAHGSTNG